MRRYMWQPMTAFGSEVCSIDVHSVPLRYSLSRLQLLSTFVC